VALFQKGCETYETFTLKLWMLEIASEDGRWAVPMCISFGAFAPGFGGGKLAAGYCAIRV
jgi:hypothetical protein